MQQVWIILLLLGVVANAIIGWLAFQDGAMGQVTTSVILGALCAAVAYLRIKQMEGKG
ncbi:MAG: hypothetical protein AAFQ54_09835 [Pseudomonadota bacterium]